VLTVQIGNNEASAGHPTSSSDVAACQNDGHYDGRHNPFSQELYDICGDTYYESYVDGCMSVEGNTKDDCESVID
jgi:hypothetical protein